MCERLDGLFEGKMVQGPEAFEENKVAVWQVDGGGEASREFDIGVGGGREVFEEVEKQAMFVVEKGWGVDDALVEFFKCFFGARGV